MSIAADVGQAFLRNLGNEAKALFTTDNSPVFDPAGFLADPDAPPLSQQPAKALGRAICRSWANRQGDGNNPAADRLYARACNPYLDSIGEQPEDGSIGLPFEGGQCSQAYLIELLQTTAQGTQPFPPFRSRVFGPIAGYRRVVIEEGDPPRYSHQIGSHNLQSNNTCGAISDIGFAWRQFSTGTGNNFTVTGIIPCGDDSCGDPPPEYKPPRPINITVPIVPIIVTLPGIGDVNIDVEVFPDANISLCSEDVGTCVEIGNPADEVGDGGGGVGPGDLVPDGGTAGAPADTGNGGTAAGEAPEGQELVGVRVEILEAPIGANEYSNVAATVYRGVGYVRMGYSGRLALDMGGAAVISPQFFLAPVRGLTNWEVRANLGFINRVTPFYRELPS